MDVRGRDIVFYFLLCFVVVSRGSLFSSCWLWQYVPGCFWELNILKRAGIPVWALKTLIWACRCESESWTPGNYCCSSWAIRITRVSGFGWAGFREYLAGPVLTFLGVETLLFSADLWCAILFFLVFAWPLFKFYLNFCVNDAVFVEIHRFRFFSLINYLISISVSLSMYAF